MKISKFKTIRVFFITLTLFAISVMPSYVSAASFYKTGSILRVLSDTANYGGCMLQLSSAIANGCPNSGWISLDCKGQFSSAENGKRAFAAALVAISLGKQISIYVDNSNKVDGFCVAKRIDLIR